jgi:hypothetical protein
MKKIITSIALASISLSTPLFAEGARDLLNKNCTRCHGDDVYSRADHKMKDLPQLRKQVNYCKGPGNAAWFDDETEEVVQFLNSNFYKF